MGRSWAGVHFGRDVVRALEHRIPPPILFALVAAAMWAAARVAPAIELLAPVRFAIAGAGLLAGLGCGAAGVLAFRRARTTINPVNIAAASALVTSGIFRYTRNPMYLGMAALLVAWAMLLAVPWTILGPVAFVLFIQRFQILPEERVMRAKFPAAYPDYARVVRRWI
jgi:protein-S-isoprenylcysteine O-methyltransferase Ste14